jgi:uncharacterized phage protein (TIGR01671 family)
MSREIKFKFWLGHTKKMTYEHSLIDIAHLHWDFTEDIIPLQYTGLKDKNDNEIYDGDIVKCLLATEPEDKGFICKFKDYRWKFNNVRYPDDDFYGTVNYNYIQQNCEVIGNIYENPELLSERS